MRTPAATGPRSSVMRVAPWKSAFARPTTRSSSPRSSGTITFWAAKYGALSAPSANATTSKTGNASPPVQWRTGITSMIGARAPSQRIIVLRAPSRARNRPPGSPSSARPTISAAITKLVCVAEPVVTSTNHGRASHVICDPVVDTISAASSATTERCPNSSRRLTGHPPDERVEFPPRARANGERRSRQVLLAQPRHRGEEQEDDAERAADHTHPDRLAQADRRAEDPAEQRADRPDAVVHEAIRADEAAAQLLRHRQREDGVLVDVEHHHAD